MECQGKLYIHAGCPASGRLATLHAYDLATHTWHKLADAPEQPRGGTAIAAVSLSPSSELVLVRFGGPSPSHTFRRDNGSQKIRFRRVPTSQSPRGHSTTARRLHAEHKHLVHRPPQPRSRTRFPRATIRAWVRPLYHHQRIFLWDSPGRAAVPRRTGRLISRPRRCRRILGRRVASPRGTRRDLHPRIAVEETACRWYVNASSDSNTKAFTVNIATGDAPEPRGWFPPASYIRNGKTRVVLTGGLLSSNERSGQVWVGDVEL